MLVKEIEAIVRVESENTQWSRLFNPLVMKVLLDYNNNDNRGYLFAMTGDLDNLGVYVGRNGRAAAENLVDLYNQIIHNCLQKWRATRKDILSLSLVPSGEEALVLGVSDGQDAPENLFNTLRNEVMLSIKGQPYIEIGDTAASFGGVVFGSEFDAQIQNLVNAVQQKNNSDDEIYPLYLEILSAIRNKTAVALDRHKFADVLEGEYPAHVRNLVLTQMLRYKEATRVIITALNSLSEENLVELLVLLGNEYGVKPQKESAVNAFIREKINK